MKLITAIIKPFKLDDVREALLELEIKGITVSEVRGFGRQKGHTEMYHGAEYVIDFLPKIKIEIIAPENEVANIIQAICDSANTNSIGDGKIYVCELSEVVRVRTGERGEGAI